MVDMNVINGFLQTCMSQSTLKFSKAETLIKLLCEAYDSQVPGDKNEVYEFIKNINKTIQDTKCSLVVVKHPRSPSEEFVVFFSNAENKNPKMHQSSNEVVKVLFGKILDALMEANNHTLPWNIGYTIGNSLPSTAKLSKQHIQTLMKNWTDQGYFLEMDDEITLGPRMIVEFENFMTREYPDVAENCPLCMKLVLWDVVCSECNKRIHRECIRKYLIKKTQCPSCSNLWNVPLH